jgi:hypothetical protein
MGSKNEPGKYDCYANAKPDEPMFVILARDPSAPELVELWAIRRVNLISEGKKPESDYALVEEARECADKMRQWRAARESVHAQYADWTTEALKEYEERLYDDEVAGEDTWFDRDQVLWELNRRGFGDLRRRQ